MGEKRRHGQQIEALRRQQRQHWLAGERITVECFFQRHPELQRDDDGTLELIYNEVLLRQRSSDKPSLAEYQQRFPHLAARLELLFAVHATLDEDSWPVGDAPTLLDSERATTHPARDLPVVPGYQILREVGRGTFGVVYEAKQQSLNRTVALKMLLAGSCAGTEERARFRTEAEAAGRLNHVCIVPVHEVGESDGRPYLVMELIPGRSLAQHLNGTPLAPRSAAGLVEKLALAIDYAHRHGIVHRDLKPANVLLEMADESCPIDQITDQPVKPSTSAFLESVTAKITDFGLAKFVAGSAADQTQSGAFMGTPSYAAPEQAEGRRREIGPAVDIYALGAILYEMLTGRPPFRGETLLETLLQVQTVEPVPPSQLRPNLPRDLTTICLKCLQKEPARRYATAEALAEDLQRFLAGMPIKARSVGPLERGWRWCRRRPAIAGLLTAMALVVAGGFGGVIWQWRRAEVNALLADVHRQRADEHRQRAETSYRLAREGLEECVAKVAENPRLKSGPLEDVRREVLQAEVLFLQKFVQLRGAEPDFQVELGRAFLRLGKLTQELATREEAIGPSQQALAIFADLALDHPTVPEYQAELASCHNNLGRIYRFTSRHGEAEQAYQDAIAIQKGLVRDHPLREDYQASLGRMQNNLAVLYQDTQRLREAEEVHREALLLRKDLVRDHPKDANYQNDLATTYSNLGVLYMSNRRFQEAHRADQDALALRKVLFHDHADVLEYKVDLGTTYNNLGSLYYIAHRLKEAEHFQQQALAIRQELVRDHPALLELAIDLAGTQCNLGQILAGKEQFESALAYYAQASTALEAVLAKEPRHVTAQQYLHHVHIGRVHALAPLGRHGEALTSWDRLLQLPGSSEQWLRMQRAITLARMKDHARAATEADALAADPDASADTYYVLSVVYSLSAAAVDAESELAGQYGARGVEMLRRAVAKGFTDVDKLLKDTDLETLRSRSDFQALRANLPKNSTRLSPSK